MQSEIKKKQVVVSSCGKVLLPLSKIGSAVLVTLETNCLFIGLDIDGEITHSLYAKN